MDKRTRLPVAAVADLGMHVQASTFAHGTHSASSDGRPVLRQLLNERRTSDNGATGPLTGAAHSDDPCSDGETSRATTIATIPAEGPYLHPDAGLVERSARVPTRRIRGQRLTPGGFGPFGMPLVAQLCVYGVIRRLPRLNLEFLYCAIATALNPLGNGLDNCMGYRHCRYLGQGQVRQFQHAPPDHRLGKAGLLGQLLKMLHVDLRGQILAADLHRHFRREFWVITGAE